MSDSALYARVIMPLAVEGTFTYSVPGNMSQKIAPGSRVLVSFGKRRIYSAIVHSLTNSPPGEFKAKPVLELLDRTPIVNQQQLQLWDWISSYYMCSAGEVMRAALPSGLRPESESRIRISPGYLDEGVLDSHERLLLEVIKDQKELTLGDIEMTGIGKNPVSILKRLVEKRAVEVNEFIRPVSVPRLVAYVRLTAGNSSEESIHLILDRLAKAPRQKGLLESYLELAGTGNIESAPLVLKSDLLGQQGASGPLRSLIKKGILEQVNREEMRLSRDEEIPHQRDPFQLTPDQSVAIEEVQAQFLKHQSVLLHGITSSGKTELYIHLISKIIEKGQQVLYLLPEIALTTQIIERIRHVFGDRVGVYHSRYSDSQRVHVYRNLLGLTDETPYQIVIGVRSAIFLPFSKLGLVIIDEEHESTFKQHDPAPRYHARDSAQVLALYHNARVVLGTATPSYETLYNARNGKFGYVPMDSRYGEVEPPEIVLANIKEATKRKQMVSHFSPLLVDGIKEALDNGEQIILFQNRRGYSHYIICGDCGEIPKCRRCDVSLTYHRGSGKLECHYCGHRESIPNSCRSCNGTNMIMKGFGTEKIEDEVALVFEGIRVGRLDTDTAGSVKGYEKMIRSFENGKLDLLIGTQMLSKGLDFDNVNLVGILDADSMLHFPDFRAFERSFQLISQVSGRAGRRKKRGKVIIQTMDPDHPVIQFIVNRDFEGLYSDQMEERELFGYPPFRKMIRISFRHRIPSILDGATDLAAKQLKSIFSTRVLGPQYPPVRKIQGSYIKQIILKIEREASFEKAKELLRGVLEDISGNEVYRSIRISIDVDPL